VDEEHYEIGEELLSIEHPKKQKIPASQFGLWEILGLSKGDTGYPRANIHNAMLVLEKHPELKDVIWYDEFHDRCFTRWQSDVTQEWSDDHDVKLTRYIQDTIGIHNINDRVVAKACKTHAKDVKRNEPKQWMDQLQWDGIERIHDFMADCMGASENNYVRAVSCDFWIAMVARIFRPGCKFDNMIVLEGSQGVFKSSALNLIGGNWFSEIHESVQHKDFYLAIQGKLLLEISELGAFSRAEIERIKHVISCADDRFRTPYESTARDHPRSCVFIGTTNEDEYLRDVSGGRRFWPIKVGQIRLDLIKENRNQYFAEAVAKFKAGASWWEVPEMAAKEEQESRRKSDVWESVIECYTDRNGLDEVDIADILVNVLKIDIGKQSKLDQDRVRGALKALKWIYKQKRVGEKRIYVWVREES